MILFLTSFIPNRIYDYQLHHSKKGTKFSYDGLTLKAKAVDIYDGDTLTLIFRYRGVLQQHSCRMLSYDSPEMKPPKNKAGRDLEISAAKEAKDALAKLVENRVLTVKCHKFDKYGRILVTLYITQKAYGFIPFCCSTSIDVNQYMIDNEYGLPYDGGTKTIVDYTTEE